MAQPEQSFIRAGIEEGFAYLKEDPPEMTVYAFGDLNNLTETYCQILGIPSSQHESVKQMWMGMAAVSGYGYAFLFTDGPMWKSMSPDERTAALVHEVYHLLQNKVVGAPGIIREPENQVPFGDPRWLIEGAAVVAHSKWKAKREGYDVSLALDASRQRMGSEPCRPQEIETWTGWNAHKHSGDCAFLAAYALEQSTGTPLLKFWEEIGRIGRWQDAFKNVFGKTVEQFYAEFTQP